ncbi:MAG: hypothetical protein AUH85_10485 [Chloroflexi bacterium 13_1_40CM_4_68_4]|nr:MAG: hypothetical protein AUH85_10485 [Chloroflexi bacterium 13_1_40CM_4_68_4]
MSERAARLGAEIDERVTKLRQRLGAIAEEDLGRARGVEGWTAGLILLHIALGLRRQAGWIDRARQGRTPTYFHWDLTHRLNARMARDHARPSRRQVEECIALGHDRMRRALARMSEDDLSREALVVGERRVSVAVVLSRIVLRHIDDHLVSLDGP